MQNTDVLIIGGSAAGMVAALTGKLSWAEKSFTVIKKQKDVMVPCGIPYIFGTLESSAQNIMPVDAALAKAGITSVEDEVIQINTADKTVETAGGNMYKYTKLVIATGSTPVRPKWLKGADKKNVFVIPKEREYLDVMKDELSKFKRIVVVGAGFIGVEFSDELAKSGFDVVLVEKMPSILSLAFDVEFSAIAEEILVKNGINVIKGKGITEIIGENEVQAVKLDTGEVIPTDAVILSIGYKPNSELAKKAGIYVDEDNFIAVDEYMRTHVADVFAIGDCAQKRDFITRKRVPTMLASTACAEARIAGMNLFNLHVIKTFSGTISIYSTFLGSTGFGTAGITEAHANEENIACLTGTFEGIDRHPGKLPDAHKQIVKLITARYSGVIIGGEVIGGTSAGELTNFIGLMIQNKMTINSLLISQIGTHPCLTASPANYPLIKAAEIISVKMYCNQ